MSTQSLPQTPPVPLSHYDRTLDCRDTSLDPARVANLNPVQPPDCPEELEIPVCARCGDETDKDATHFNQPSPFGEWLGDYCDECQERNQAELAQRAERACVDARQKRLRVETLCGMGLRYAKGKWVLATDIRGVCLLTASLAGEPAVPSRLTLKTATCGLIDVTEQPYFTDLCAELGVGCGEAEGASRG